MLGFVNSNAQASEVLSSNVYEPEYLFPAHKI